MAQRVADRGRLSAARRLALVQEVAAHLAEEASVAGVLSALDASLSAGLGATSIIVNVADTDATTLETLWATGTSAPTDQLLRQSIPLTERMPATAVLREGRTLFWSSLDERNSAYPAYASFPSACESWAILPLTVHGVTHGVLSIGWSAPQRFEPDDRAMLEVVAHQCAIALERVRLIEVERSERATLELMSKGTELMVSDLNPAHVVERLVELAVPRLAPWCAAYVAAGDVLRRVAIEIEPDARLADELRGLDAAPIDADTALARCFRTGVAEVVASITADDVRAVFAEPTRTRILRAGEEWTGLVVPIKSSGQVIGVMSLVSPHWAGSPPGDVWHAAEGLAGRAGVALMNARRFDDEHSTATYLTKTLLPGEIQRVEGYDSAARYVPAEGRVAGDWFDVVPLPNGEVLVGVGDVGGHGLRAASTMTQLRNAARGLALGGASPSGILRGLGQFVTLDGGFAFATCLYGLLDPPTGRFRWSTAGHYPPLAFDGDDAAWLALAEHPPLGAPALVAAEERYHLIEPGHGLVLVTDGVVERRGADIGTGMAGIRDVVERHARRGAVALANALAAAFCVATHDDCCVVVLQRNPPETP